MYSEIIAWFFLSCYLSPGYKYLILEAVTETLFFFHPFSNQRNRACVYLKRFENNSIAYSSSLLTPTGMQVT